MLRALTVVAAALAFLAGVPVASAARDPNECSVRALGSSTLRLLGQRVSIAAVQLTPDVLAPSPRAQVCIKVVGDIIAGLTPAEKKDLVKIEDGIGRFCEKPMGEKETKLVCVAGASVEGVASPASARHPPQRVTVKTHHPPQHVTRSPSHPNSATSSTPSSARSRSLPRTACPSRASASA